VFFANSGTEATEAAIKFARGATGRPGIVYCDHAFHGLTNGALSLNGDAIFRAGFEPLLPQTRVVPFNDLAALERALVSRDVAAFIVEPIQGKGVNVPDDDYLREAAALCRRHGTLFVADEIQTGLGRTGRFLAVEHWGVEPDMVLLAKALSGGHVPIGAVLTRKSIYDKIFHRIDRAVVHGSTYAKNDLAMAAGIATLDVLRHERIIPRAEQLGERLLAQPLSRTAAKAEAPQAIGKLVQRFGQSPSQCPRERSSDHEQHQERGAELVTQPPAHPHRAAIGPEHRGLIDVDKPVEPPMQRREFIVAPRIGIGRQLGE